jgi:hypothetical protein
VADVPSNLNADGQIFSLLILIGIACFKPLKSNESPSILPYQKVLRVVLTHFHKRKELIFAKLVQDLNPNNPKTYPYMVSVIFIAFWGRKRFLTCSLAHRNFGAVRQSIPGI